MYRTTAHTMTFTVQIVIGQPRERVIELIRNPAYLAAWQPGWRYGPLLAGEEGQPGARRRVFVEFQGVRLEMVETVLIAQPPAVFASLYTARGVTNRVENHFYAESPGATRWVISNAFQFSGLMALVGGFVGDFVPRQTVASMQRFKHFAERW